MDLQKIAFKDFQPELLSFALSHLAGIETRPNLKQNFELLSTEKLLELSSTLDLRFFPFLSLFFFFLSFFKTSPFFQNNKYF